MWEPISSKQQFQHGSISEYFLSHGFAFLQSLIELNCVQNNNVMSLQQYQSLVESIVIRCGPLVLL